MKMRKIMFLVFTFLFLASQTALEAQETSAVDTEYQIGAILFHQYAAEYRALAFQAFNVARIRLEADKQQSRKLPRSERKRPRAIIVDADETVMDNSPYFAGLAKRGEALSLPGFLKWNESLEAKPVPGALEFLKFAASEGIEIFYVSNRPASFQQTSVANLKNAGFPNADDQHVLLITDTSSKEPRRQSIHSKYRVVMLIGDNLNDFSDAFEAKSVNDRFEAVDQRKSEWGTKFIVVPNAMYGAWESAIYENQRLTDAEKKAKRHESLKTFQPER